MKTLTDNKTIEEDEEEEQYCRTGMVSKCEGQISYPRILG
jgi:hypothetical protein